MLRDQLHELHYIAPLSNAPSILRHGLVSHNLADRVDHENVANPEVQGRRATREVPNGLLLHDYVNLYFHGRNPMLFYCHEQHEQLCVFRIDTAVLDLDGVVVTDKNAAKDLVRFSPVGEGLTLLDHDLVFARDWRHPGDVIQYERHKGIKCAEVLVPRRVPRQFLIGAYVSLQGSGDRLRAIDANFDVTLDPDFFFQ